MIPETKCLMVKFPVGVSSLFLSTSSMFTFSPIIMASTQLSQTWAHSLLPSQNREWDMQTRGGLCFVDQHLYTRQRTKDTHTVCKNIPQLSCFFLPQKDQGLSSTPEPFWPVSVRLGMGMILVTRDDASWKPWHIVFTGIALGGLQFCSFSACFEENTWKKTSKQNIKKKVSVLTEALRSINKYKYMRLAAWLYRYIGKNSRVIFEMQKIIQWVIFPTLWLAILSHFRFDPGGHSTQPENRQWDDVAWLRRSAPWEKRPIPSAGKQEGCSGKVWKMLLS